MINEKEYVSLFVESLFDRQNLEEKVRDKIKEKILKLNKQKKDTNNEMSEIEKSNKKIENENDDLNNIKNNNNNNKCFKLLREINHPER